MIHRVAHGLGQALADMVEKQLAGILAHWKWGLTNAFMEGLPWQRLGDYFASEVVAKSSASVQSCLFSRTLSSRPVTLRVRGNRLSSFKPPCSKFFCTRLKTCHRLGERSFHCTRPNFFSNSFKLISMIVGRPCGQV